MTDPLRPACCATRTALSAYGFRMQIRSSGTDLSELLPSVLPPLTRPSAGRVFDRVYALRTAGPCACGCAHDATELFVNRQLLYRGSDVAPLHEQLRITIKLDVAERARGRVFLHAGAVGWKGAGLLLPGRSMSGKTTLVRALLQAGAVYYSDEFAIIDPDGRLHPYPQPLGIRTAGSRTQRDRSPESLGATTASSPIPVRAIVATNYEPGTPWSAARMTPGETVLAMLGHAVAARRNPKRVLATLERVARRAIGYSGSRGDAAGAAGELLALVEESRSSRAS